MEYGICPLSVVPVRAEPDDGSEMVTQLLFGETLRINKAHNQWRHITCRYDGYEGWIDEKQYQPLDNKALAKAEDNPSYALEIAQSATNQSHHIPIVLGSTLPQYDGINFKLGKDKYWYNGQAYNPVTTNHKPTVLEKIVHKYHYAPYLWGGRSPFGVDCSGFTQVIFKILGVPLKRDSNQQVEQGEEVAFIDAAQPGDLAFFPNKAGHIAHVGIILDQKRIIHAHGRVRIDTIDHYGIYNEEKQAYSHQLRTIKRVL